MKNWFVKGHAVWKDISECLHILAIYLDQCGERVL